ncbi:MAG: hypothetical protein QFC78_00270 [Pseudomonadota bacterium]|nr:hypothetical protein [Pseudomonadota bacterium]
MEPEVSFLRKAFAVRIVAAVLFVVTMLALIGATLLREAMASQSPAVRSRLVLAKALATTKDPALLEAQARQLALRDPLQAAAFVLVGVARTQAKPTPFDQIHPLMEAALQRQPSLDAPQIWLAADYARRGDFNRSLDLLDKVLTLSGDYTDALMPVLADLLKYPQSRAAVIAKLRQYPVWRTALVTKAIETKVIGDDLLIALLADPVPAVRRGSVDLERMQFVGAMVSRGEVERAHAFYRGYVGIDPRSPIYDGNFTAEPPFKPFGWIAAASAEDYTERVARGNGGWAMRLHASGDRSATLIEQTLALNPGRWTVELTGRDAGLAKPANNRLVLECLNQDQPLGTYSLGHLRGDDSTLRVAFVVPQGCPLQRLAIKAGDNGGEASEIEVTAFKVTAS